jgi:hypothetical protein
LRYRLFLVLILFLSFSPPAFAGVVIINDGFTDTAQVDQGKTTAWVDTESKCVVLPRQSLAGAVSAMENGYGYAVASKAGVSLYELNDATGIVEENPIFSCPWVADATGVSIRQDNLNIWAVTGDSIAYYKFNGGGMSNDPALKAGGLLDVLSVAAFKAGDSALLLQREGNKARITRYDAGESLNPALVFSPDILDPVAISMVNDSPDFRLFTKTAVYYFSYDDSGGTYIEDPIKRIAGLAGVISGSSDGTGNSILTESDLGYYMSDDTSGASRVEVYSPGPAAGPVAVSLKYGTYEQVYLDESGSIKWWSYDDAAGCMVRVPSLEFSGPGLNRGYAHPRSYYSIAVNTSATYDAARLAITDDRPANTSIDYFVSSDGGGTYTAITPGAWTSVPRGCSFTVKAVLDTGDPQVTPAIFHITLEVEDDIILEGYVVPDPAERDRNATISARAVRLTTGGAVALDSCAAKYPLETKADGDPALPDGELPTVAVMAYNPGSGFWEYTFTVPAKTADGRWPDDGVYLAEITGTSGGVVKKVTINFEVHGNIMNRLIIKTISW